MKIPSSKIAFVLVIAFASCVSKKNLSDAKSTGSEPPMTPEMAVMMNKVKATQLPYKWFAAAGTGKIDWDGQRLSGRVNVRILHDSIIWVQIQKLGFEVGRMLITKDSAFFINRFERTYSRYGTRDFLIEYDIPADFDMFSRVFTAGAYIPPAFNYTNIEEDGSVFLQSASGMRARHWFDSTSLLTRSTITDPLAREWISIYSDYQRTNSGQAFPYKRLNTFVIEGMSNLFDLEYTEMEIDVPQEFPFSIPSHYEKI